MHFLCTQDFLLFLPCGTLFHVLNAQVMWRYEEHSICTINEDRQSSLKWGVHGVILFIVKSFLKLLNLSVDLRSYNG